MVAIGLFMARFVYVFASAFQQKSVIGNHYGSIPVTCYIRSVCDYASWGLVGYSAANFTTIGTAVIEVFFMGTGATVGVFVGMYVHNRVYKEKL